MFARRSVELIDKTPLTMSKFFRENRKKTSDRVVQTAVFAVFLAFNGQLATMGVIADLQSFVVVSVLYCASVTGICFIYRIWLAEQTVSLDDVEEFDAAHGGRDAGDATLEAVWLAMESVVWFALIGSSFTGQSPTVALSLYASWALAVVPVGQVFLLKCLIVRRLGRVLSDFGDRERFPSNLSGLRCLLDLNDRVNEDFSTPVGLVFLMNLASLTFNLAAVWSSVVLGRDYFGSPLTVLAGCLLAAVLDAYYLAAVVASSGVAARMRRISDKMDEMITMEIAPGDPDRYKLLVLMHELSQVEPDMTPMGLFTVNNGSVFPFLTLLISNLMIFMQYL